jgi:glutamate dehydrogenase
MQMVMESPVPKRVCTNDDVGTSEKGAPATKRARFDDIVQKVAEEQIKVANETVPWYMSQMPAPYFREVSDETRLEHIKAAVTLRGVGQKKGMQLNVTTESADGEEELTIMATSGRPGTLYKMFENLEAPSSKTLHRVRAYSSHDASLILNMFVYVDDLRNLPKASPTHAKSKDVIAHAVALGEVLRPEVIGEYFEQCTPKYVEARGARSLFVQQELYKRVRGTEGVEVHVRGEPAGGEANLREQGVWITLAVSNGVPMVMLARLSHLLFMRGLNVYEMWLDTVIDPSPQAAMGDQVGTVSMIRFLLTVPKASCLPAGVKPFHGDPARLNADAWHSLTSEMARLKFLDASVLDLALNKCPEFDMDRAEIVTAMCSMLHGRLSKLDANGFSRPTLFAMVAKSENQKYFQEIADLFAARFDPKRPLVDEAFKIQSAKLKERMEQMVSDENSRILMTMMVDVVEHTLRTNFYVPNRCSLAFRLDPRLLISEGQEVPFGALFVRGHGFDGFHNRFQNIARGGCRLVTPASKEQHAIESSRCYDEVYGLSSAQQLKNKDIPEGGSKAVVLVDVAGQSLSTKKHNMRASFKAFTDAILDLITTKEETRRHIVDFLGFEELVYLGPDEQVLPDDINWVVGRAATRGYPIPAAFMSSKPLAGINHKEYGVTSEGVAVYLDVALRACGIQPDKQPFTIKIAGGPDGDVAGNLMRILYRDYGSNAKIVGVADGFGCAEDPDGLPSAELLRLFHAGLPITHLDVSKLGGKGLLYHANNEEGAKMRNTMHNRVKADVFVPAGGRPNTMNAGNWQLFLDPVTKKPSSPLIVEGANIYLTPQCRELLFKEAGVQIVKDSSANKCGVITSSYEICASMLLEEKEFLAIKGEVVADVLKRLRELARLEAELLFREYGHYDGSLPHFSMLISKCINRTALAIQKQLAGMKLGDALYNELKPLFLEEHLPQKLAQVAGDRVDTRIPIDYMRNAFGKILASKLLYREGIHFVESQPEDHLAELALRYHREEKLLQPLLKSLQGAKGVSDADRKRAIDLLTRGGVRSSLNVY